MVRGGPAPQRRSLRHGRGDSRGDHQVLEAAWQHADATIEALPIDAPGHVEWWGDRGDVTLQVLLVHMSTEVHRHAGHADILREMVDGAIGHRAANDNLPEHDPQWWLDYHAMVQREADPFAP